MSTLADGSITIYEALQAIKSGWYVMPAFQRQYVWSMEQVEKLWDSVLLGYPVSTFLFWRIDESNVSEDTLFCQFLQEATFNSRKQSDSPNYELGEVNFNTTSVAVLDGQQRLTSLFLSLLGTAYIRPRYARKGKRGERIVARLLLELNVNRLNLDEDEYNSKKFDVMFGDKAGKLSPTQFELRRIMEPEFRNDETRTDAIERAIANVPPNSGDYARSLLNTLCSKVFEEKLIRYTEISDMGQDDALEMFVRFNSGGKPLKKSEITMAILEAYWPSAKSEFGKVLVGPYEGFGGDFIIRCAFMLYGNVVKANISKGLVNQLRDDWVEFKRTLTELDMLLGGLGIDTSRFASSWNVLLPVIYYVHYNPSFREGVYAVKCYLLRAALFNYFRSGTTAKLQQMKSNINAYDKDLTVEMLDNIDDLRVTDARLDDILDSEKGSKVAGEALYYLGLGWINKAFKYEHDHLHPYDQFDTKPVGVSREDWSSWRSNRNRLANLQLLEGRSNGSKSDMSLRDYYNDMNYEQRKQFEEQAMIPEGVSLEISHFGEFYEARRELIKGRLRELLG